MFLNSIFLVFAIFFLQASGAVKKYQASHSFSVIYAIFFFPFPLFWSLLLAGQTCSWWHSHRVWLLQELHGLGCELRATKKPWKTTHLTNGSFYWNLCTNISEKNPSTPFTANLEFLGASSERFPKAGSWNPRTEDTDIPIIKPLKRQAQALWFCSWFIWAFLSRQNKRCFQFLATPRPSKQQKVIIYRNYANSQTWAAYDWGSCCEIVISENSCQNSSCHHAFYKTKLPGCPEKIVQTLYKSHQLKMNLTAAALKSRTEHVWDEESG